MLVRSPSIVLIIASLGFTGVAAFLISRFQQHSSHSHWYVEIVSILGLPLLSSMHALLLIKKIPTAGVEPAATWLKARCSTTELRRLVGVETVVEPVA